MHMNGLFDDNIIKIDENKVVKAINENDIGAALENTALVVKWLTNGFKNVHDRGCPINSLDYKYAIGLLVDPVYTLDNPGNIFEIWKDPNNRRVTINKGSYSIRAYKAYEKAINDKHPLIRLLKI